MVMPVSVVAVPMTVMPMPEVAMVVMMSMVVMPMVPMIRPGVAVEVSEDGCGSNQTSQ
jgi:hypothetical protein